MAKQASVPAKAGFIDRIRQFFTEVHHEMTKVTWPPWEELKHSTAIVLFMLVLFASIIFVMDRVFNTIVMLILRMG